MDDVKIEYRMLTQPNGRDIEQVRQVAKILHSWWGEDCGMLLSDMELLCYQDTGVPCHHCDVPRTWIATCGETVVGCIKLVTNDADFRKDLYPFASSLFVLEEYRNRGVATSLIEEMLRYAFVFCSFDEVYLATGLKGFYDRFGFSSCGEDYVYFDWENGRIKQPLTKDTIYRITRSQYANRRERSDQ